jgi:hypothetical protein
MQRPESAPTGAKTSTADPLGPQAFVRSQAPLNGGCNYAFVILAVPPCSLCPLWLIFSNAPQD